MFVLTHLELFKFIDAIILRNFLGISNFKQFLNVQI